MPLPPFLEALRFVFCCGAGATTAAGKISRLTGDGDFGFEASPESAAAVTVGALLLLVGEDTRVAAPPFGAAFLRYDGSTRPDEGEVCTALPGELLGLGRARALSALLMPLATDAALPLLVRAPKSWCFSASPPTAEALGVSLRIPNLANMADFFATSSAGAMSSTKVSPNLFTVFQGLVTWTAVVPYRRVGNKTKTKPHANQRFVGRDRHNTVQCRATSNPTGGGKWGLQGLPCQQWISGGGVCVGGVYGGLRQTNPDLDFDAVPLLLGGSDVKFALLDQHDALLILAEHGVLLRH